MIHLVANYDLTYETTASLSMPRMFPTDRWRKRGRRLCPPTSRPDRCGHRKHSRICNRSRFAARSRRGFSGGINIVPAHRVHPTERAPMSESDKAALGLDDFSKLLLTVARLEPVKMVGDFVRAFSIVVQKHPDALLILAGQGSERERLQALAEELGIADRVRFLGLISQDVLVRLAPGCLALSPMTGIALFETSMAGCPAIAYIATPPSAKWSRRVRPAPWSRQATGKQWAARQARCLTTLPSLHGKVQQSASGPSTSRTRNGFMLTSTPPSIDC